MGDPHRQGWETAGVWFDMQDVPRTLQATLEQAEISDAAAALRGARRIFVSGNGSSYYAALAMWAASLASGSIPVVPLPAGVLISGRFVWREGDRLVAISSSGEMRDLIEAVSEPRCPRPIIVVTSDRSSTLARLAGALIEMRVPERRATAPTQDFCGAVMAVLMLLAEISHDKELGNAVKNSPELFARILPLAKAIADDATEQLSLLPFAGLAFGSGSAWPAALEAALLLKELAGVHIEGFETREIAHGAMAALGPGHLVTAIPTARENATREVAEICRTFGASVIEIPTALLADSRLAALTAFAPAVTLSLRIAQEQGIDPDRPRWFEAYLSTARV